LKGLSEDSEGDSAQTAVLRRRAPRAGEVIAVLNNLQAWKIAQDLGPLLIVISSGPPGTDAASVTFSVQVLRQTEALWKLSYWLMQNENVDVVSLQSSQASGEVSFGALRRESLSAI